MTADTHIWVDTVSKQHYIMPVMSCVWCPDYTGGTTEPDAWVEYPVEYNRDFKLTATPKPGYVFYYWRGPNNRDVQYQRSINVKAEIGGWGNYEAAFVTEGSSLMPPDPPSRIGTVVVSGEEGSADIFTGVPSGSDDLLHTTFVQSSTLTYGSFGAHCHPHQGYDLAYWHWSTNGVD